MSKDVNMNIITILHRKYGFHLNMNMNIWIYAYDNDDVSAILVLISIEIMIIHNRSVRYMELLLIFYRYKFSPKIEHISAPKYKKSVSVSKTFFFVKKKHVSRSLCFSERFAIFNQNIIHSNRNSLQSLPMNNIIFLVQALFIANNQTSIFHNKKVKVYSNVPNAVYLAMASKFSTLPLTAC